MTKHRFPDQMRYSWVEANALYQDPSDNYATVLGCTACKALFLNEGRVKQKTPGAQNQTQA